MAPGLAAHVMEKRRITFIVDQAKPAIARFDIDNREGDALPQAFEWNDRFWIADQARSGNYYLCDPAKIDIPSAKPIDPEPRGAVLTLAPKEPKPAV